MAEETADAIQVGLDTEKEGLEMYTRLAKESKNPVASKMFEGLSGDEKAHLKMIKEVARGMGLSDALEEAQEGSARQRMKTIFSDAKGIVDETLPAKADEFDAIRTAMQFEKKGYSFYQDAADEAADEDQKALFERLAEEENEHYRILEETLSYLEDAGAWTIWDEGGLLTGDFFGGAL